MVFTLTRQLLTLFVTIMLLIGNNTSALANDDFSSRLTLQLDSKHQFSHAGFYVAVDQGFYKALGLSVIINEGKTSLDPVTQLIKGNADYVIDGSSIIHRINQNSNLRVLATIEQFSPWVLLTHPNVTIQSLKNTLIAMPHQASEINAMLYKAGLLETDYRLIKSGDISLFIDGKVAAIAVRITDLPHISSQISIPYDLINSTSAELNFYGASIISTSQHLINNNEQARRFKQASIKGWKYAIDKPQYAARLIQEQYNNDLSYNSLLVEARQVTYLMRPQLLDIGDSSTMRWQQIATVLNISNENSNVSNLVYLPKIYAFKYSHTLLLICIVLLVFFVFIPVSLLWRSKHLAIKEMRLMNSILRTQQQASNDGILTFDAQGKVVSVNKQLKQLWKLSDSKFKQTDTWQVIYSMVRQVSNSKEFIATVRMHNADNNMQTFSEISLIDGRTFERFSAPLFDEQKNFVGRFWSFRDITQRKLAEENIWLQANFDSLTDLPNRLMFKERLIFEIKKSARSGKQIALLFLDLDRFKEINDSMGHDVGDQLLIEVAARLKKCVRDVDMVARLGGDEFTIILSDLENRLAIDRIAQSILASLATPFLLDGQPHYISTSIGITFSPSDGVDDVQLLKNADQAMYHAKALGRNNFQYFTPELQTKASKRVSMSNDLRIAIEKKQLFLEYQPIVCLKEHKILKAEALLRWQHPELGLIPPNDFIELAEETGLINVIGEWVFEQAAKQVEIFQRTEPDFTISVNTSPVQYHSGTIDPTSWSNKLLSKNIKEKSIIVELTETLLMNSDDSSAQTLKKFREHNIPIALDDFGTGYSSMSYLSKFDIDFLKIDRSFVSNLTPNSKELVLCQAIITMAKSLGMTIIAEGIETKQQQDLLTTMGCDYGQGFYFSKPVRASAISQLITQQSFSTIT